MFIIDLTRVTYVLA